MLIKLVQTCNFSAKCTFLYTYYFSIAIMLIKINLSKSSKLKFIKITCKNNRLALCPWEIFHAFLSSADFFSKSTFRKILSEIPFEYQTVWIQIRPDIWSGLIWVQTVCKGYQQMTLGGRVNSFSLSGNFCHF